MDVVLAGCASALESRGKISESKARRCAARRGACNTHSELLGTQATKQLVNLLTAPLEAYDVVSVLSLSSYPKLMDVLEHNTRKQMAVTIVRSVLKSGTIVQEVEQARSLQQRRACIRLTICASRSTCSSNSSRCSSRTMRPSLKRCVWLGP